MKTDFRKAEPVIKAYARSRDLIGPSGSGQLTKMVNQICIGGLIQGLAEALHFAKRAGLDIQKVIDTISKGAAQSWQMENRWQDHGRGQVRLRLRRRLDAQGFRASCFDEARRNGAELPVTALVDQFYAEVQAMRRRPLGYVEPDCAAGAEDLAPLLALRIRAAATSYI